MALKAGQPAPEFERPDQSGKTHRLSDYRGQHVLLYFYPKDDTTGCTTEACNFRDDYSDYQKAGVTILGVSPDSQDSHTKFRDKYGLPFTLLADTDHSLCEAYDVWGTKKMFGNEYEGVFRTTYLIGPEGEILETFENVKPEDHSGQVLERLQNLS